MDDDDIAVTVPELPDNYISSVEREALEATLSSHHDGSFGVEKYSMARAFIADLKLAEMNSQ